VSKPGYFTVPEALKPPEGVFSKESDLINTVKINTLTFMWRGSEEV
jgi:hypothetical protein